MHSQKFSKLFIPETIAAGPGPGHTDIRVLESFANAGMADHMHTDVLRGMVECKHMLREIWGTKNIHTFGVAGTGWSGLDMLFSAITPGDKVVAFSNGTFSSIDALTLRIKAATNVELATDGLNPRAASVVIVDIPHGHSVTEEIIETAIADHQPKWAFMAHWETGSGRINDIEGFSKSCVKHGAMGLIDAVSSLGVENFTVDDYPGIVGWASCPQKGICCLPLTYAPISLSDRYITTLKSTGARTFVHHPIFEARHWGIIEGKDVTSGTYHRTHSGYAVAAFHEALRITLEQTITQRAKDYAFFERIVSELVTAMGCKVTSNMTSLVVLNLPDCLEGREMELVQNCRSQGFGIWPTLSSPVQIRIGILNQLTPFAISQIVNRFAQAMTEMGAELDWDLIDSLLNQHFSGTIAAE